MAELLTRDEQAELRRTVAELRLELRALEAELMRTVTELGEVLADVRRRLPVHGWPIPEMRDR